MLASRSPGPTPSRADADLCMSKVDVNYACLIILEVLRSHCNEVLQRRNAPGLTGPQHNTILDRGGRFVGAKAAFGAVCQWDALPPIPVKRAQHRPIGALVTTGWLNSYFAWQVGEVSEHCKGGCKVVRSVKSTKLSLSPYCTHASN
jgi:hypothetical protein